MPGALKARETDGGSAVETTTMDTKLVVAGEVGVDIVNRGKSDESSGRGGRKEGS